MASHGARQHPIERVRRLANSSIRAARRWSGSRAELAWVDEVSTTDVPVQHGNLRLDKMFANKGV
jgi:hypothetical protein